MILLILAITDEEEILEGAAEQLPIKVKNNPTIKKLEGSGLSKITKLDLTKAKKIQEINAKRSG